MLSQDDKKYVGEMFEQQASILMQHIDGTVAGAKEELRKEIRAVSTKIDDRIGDVRSEFKQDFAKHVAAGHSA